MDRWMENGFRVVDWLLWMMRVSLNKLIPLYTPFESKVLQKLKDNINEDFIFTFEEQFKTFNVVRRFDTGDVEISFLHWSPNSLRFKPKCQSYFDQSKPNEKLCHFSVDFGDKIVNCTLVARYGVISHINMSYPKTLYNHFKNNSVVSVVVKSGRIVCSRNA